MKAEIFNALSARRTKDNPDATEIEFLDAKGNVQPVHLSRSGQAQLIRDLLALHSGFTHRDHPLSTIHALSAQPLALGTDSEGIEFLLGPGLFLRVSMQRESMRAFCNWLNQSHESTQ
ncbi:MAG: hypothetical protein M3Q32_11715 [Pseudomonadota bacterium]|nr:hypothetical protein [Burkholderiales bacterium]MDQ3196993.1 hypothetical protein [Pseudomonadota bacterium]